MALIISAWTGDNAGPVLGRPTNTLLVAINATNGTAFPSEALTLTDRQLLGFPTLSVPWYPALSVACLVSLTSTGGPLQFPPRAAVAIGCTPLPWTLPGSSAPFPSELGIPPLTPNVYLIELAQVVIASQEGSNIHSPWRAGINLFSLTLQSDSSNGVVSAIGTVPSTIKSRHLLGLPS